MAHKSFHGISFNASDKTALNYSTMRLSERLHSAHDTDLEYIYIYIYIYILYDCDTYTEYERL